MYIAICDDERECVEQIEACLDNFKKAYKNIKWEVFYSAEELLKYYQVHNNEFDVLITDIEMKSINGIELANQVRSMDSSIIIFFLSSHDEYIRQCFEPAPANFWDKPIQYKQFKLDMEKAIIRAKENSKVFLLKENDTRLRVPYKDIICFLASGKKIIAQTEKRNYEFYGSCGEYENQWFESNFIKINRGCYINTLHIESMRGQEIFLKNGNSFPVSRANMKNVKMLFCESDYKEAMRLMEQMGDD